MNRASADTVQTLNTQLQDLITSEGSFGGMDAIEALSDIMDDMPIGSEIFIPGRGTEQRYTKVRGGWQHSENNEIANEVGYMDLGRGRINGSEALRSIARSLSINSSAYNNQVLIRRTSI